MNYSLSNRANISLLREKFGLSFKYPSLYKPKLKIDGNKEQSLSVITIEESNLISEGIWGILPQNFDGDWRKFQRLRNTLHVNKKEICKNVLFKEALEKRRCLIIVTGFYTHYLNDNNIINYLVEKEDVTPFYIAGIYNVLKDGFITCTVVNTKTKGMLNSENSLYEFMPLQIPEIFKNIWLNRDAKLDEINHIISKPYTAKFKIQEIIS